MAFEGVDVFTLLRLGFGSGFLQTGVKTFTITIVSPLGRQ